MFIVLASLLMYNCNGVWYSQVHTRVAGSGLHLWSAPHTAVILLVGTNPGLHLKCISAPSVVFWYGSMEPSIGGVGSLQLTGGREMESKENYPVIYNPRYCRITTVGWRKKGDNTKSSGMQSKGCSLHDMPYWNVNASYSNRLVYKTLMSFSVYLAYTLLNHTSNKP